MAMSWLKKAARTTVMVIANLSVAIQPVLAQSIVPDRGANAPGVLRTSNGIDLVQIERPNSAGVSVNTYDQFNVATSGAILNNISSNYGITNLGGFVQGNPNLSGGTASLIINEVTSTKPSELLGYIEVGGARANVVVANANGITCNGCGFINTDHVALTTGGLTFASDGALDTINVTRGLIEIGARGADARGVSQFDLIARQVNFAGTVQGQRVLVIAGQNDVIFATGAAETTDDGTASPEYSIDSTVFGGMYANKITIVSTEQGSGVRAPATMSSSAQGMTITADGRLVIGQATSQGRVTARAPTVVVTETVYSREPLTLEAKQDMILAADGAIVSDAAANLTAGRHLTVEAGGQIAARNALTLNVGQTLALAARAQLMSYRDMRIGAGAADMDAGSLVYAGAADTGVTPATAKLNFNIVNDAALDSARLYATGALTFNARDITIGSSNPITQSQLVSLGELTVTARNATTAAARLEAAGNVRVALQQALRAGNGTVIASDAQLVLRSDEMMLAGTVLQSEQGIVVETAGDVTATGLTAVSTGAAGIAVTADNVNLQGSVAATAGNATIAARAGDVTLTGTTQAQAQLSVTASNAVTTTGNLQGNTFVALNGATIRNGARVYAGAATLIAGVGDVVNTGAIGTPGALTINATQAINNSGVVQTGGTTSLLAATTLTNTGAVSSGGDISLRGMTIDNAAALTTNNALRLAASADLVTTGVLQAGGILSLAAAGSFTSTSTLLSNTSLTLSAGGDLATVGNFATTGALTVTAGGTLTNAGTSATAGQATARDVRLSGANVTNTGDLIAVNDLTIVALRGALTNSGDLTSGNVAALTAATDLTNAATLTGTTGLTLNAQGGVLTNSGVSQAQGAVALMATGAISNAANLISNTSLAVTAGSSLTNDGGFLTGGAATYTAATTLINRGDGLANTGASAAALLFTAANIQNAGNAGIAGNVIANATQGTLVNSGTILAGGTLTYGAATDLTNSGILRSTGALTVNAVATLDNQGTIETGAALTLIAARMSNAGVATAIGNATLTTRSGDLTSAGTIAANGLVTVTAAQALRSTGQISAGDVLTLRATSTLANDGIVQSVGALNLAAATIINTGALSTNATLRLEAVGDLTTSGQLQSNGALTLSAGGALTSASTLVSNTRITAAAGSTLTSAGNYATPGALTLTAGDLLTNSGTSLTAGQAVALTVVLTGASVSNTGDLAVVSDATLTATTGAVTNTGTLTIGRDLLLDGATDVVNSGAILVGQNFAVVTGSGTFSNAGAITAQGGLSFQTAQDFTNASDLITNGDLTIVSGGAVTNDGGFLSGGIVTFTAAGALINRGNGLSTTGASAASLTLTGGSVANTGSSAIAGAITLAANLDGVTNAGALLSGAALALTGVTTVINTGDLRANAALTLNAGTDLTNDGGLLSATTLNLIAQGDLINRGDGLGGPGADAMTILLRGATVNNTGDLAAVTTLGLNATSGVLVNSGVLVAGGAVTLDGLTTLTNAGAIQSAASLLLTAATIINTADLTSGAALQLVASADLMTAGALQTGGALTLTAGRNLVSDSTFLVQTGINLTATNALTTRGDFVTAGDITMTAGGVLTNAGGALLVGQAVGRNLTLTGAITNNSGIFTAAGNVLLSSLGGAVTNTGDIAAAGTINLTGPSVVNNAALAAAGDLDLSSTGTLTNTGSLSTQGVVGLTSVGDLRNTGDLTGVTGIVIASQNNATNSGGFVTQGSMSAIVSGTLVNSGNGLAPTGASAHQLRFVAGQIENNGDALIADTIVLTAIAGDLVNTGDFAAGTTVTLTASQLLRNGGALTSAGLLTLTGGSIDNGGALGTNDFVNVRALTGTLANNGDVVALAGLTLDGATNITNAGDLRTGGALQLNAGGGSLVNDGDLLSSGQVRFAATGAITNRGDGLSTTGASAQQLTFTGASVNNAGDFIIQDQIALIGATGAVTQSGALRAGNTITLTAAGNTVNIGGTVLTAADLIASGQAINSTGAISAQGNVTLTATDGALAQTGTLLSNGNITLRTPAGALTQGGILQSGLGNVAVTANSAVFGGIVTAAGMVTANVTGSLTNTGSLNANTTINLQAANAVIGGTVTGITGVTIGSAARQSVMLNGTIASNGAITVRAQQITMGTAASLTSAGADITLAASDLLSTAGAIRVQQDLLGTGARIVQNATVTAGISASLTSATGDIAQSGTITAQAIALNAGRDIINTGTLNGAVGLTAMQDVSNAGTIAGGLLLINARDIVNQASGVLNTTGRQQLIATRDLINRGDMTASASLIANASGTLDNYGRIDAGGQLSITVGALNNRLGARAEGNTLLIDGDTLRNAGRLQSAGALTLTATTSLNNSGSIQSGGALGITTPAMTNAGSIDAFGGFLIVEGLDALNNRNGRLSSDMGVQIGVRNAVDFGSASWGTVQSDGWIRLQGLNGGYMTALTVDTSAEIVAQGALFIKASGITNNGTIASATDNLVLQSDRGITNTGVIYAGGDVLALRARDTITNDGGAILAANAMVVCGIATSDCISNIATDRAGGLTNTNGGTIETFSGDMILAADAILNTTGGTQTIVSNGPTALPLVNNDPGGCSGFCFGDDSYNYTKVRETRATTTVTITGTASSIISGGSIAVNAATVENFYSLISATDNIDFTAGSVTNTGADSTRSSVIIIERWRFIDRTFPRSNIRRLQSTDAPIIENVVTARYFATIEAGGNITGVINGPLQNGRVTDSLSSLTAVGASRPAVSASLQTAAAVGAQGFNGIATPTIGAIGNVGAATLGQQNITAGTADAGLSNLTLPASVSALTLAPRNYVAPTVGSVTPTVSTSTSGSTAALNGTGATAPTVSGIIRQPLRDLAPVLTGIAAVDANGNAVTAPSVTNGTINLADGAAGLQNASAVGGNTTINPERIIGVLDLSALRNDQLFAVNPGSDSNYLIETRQSFIDQSTFLSSDYFLDALNLDPDVVQQRLGDALAETYLIRNQIFNLIGRRILDSGLSEREQIRNMYDNAIDAARNLGLRPGVALTPQQIAALTEDIIWLEERIVSGQVVLVPQVYLARSAGIGGVFAPSTITATNISLQVGSLTNINGAITALDQLAIAADGNIINQFGAITAGDLLQLTTAGDVQNLSGVITGGDVNIVANNILSETLAVRVGTDAFNFDDIAGVTAEITATTGQLNLDAVNNITVIGGNLSAVSGISVLAGGDIDFAALQLDTRINRVGDGSSLEVSNSLAQVSNINVSEGGLNITSVQLDEEGMVIGSGNVLFEGTQIAAAGVIDINAYNGSVIFGAAIDSTYSDMFQEDDGFFVSSTYRQETLNVSAQTTNVTGSAINVFGAGTVYDASSGFSTTDGDLTIRSGTGDVIFSSVTEINAQNTYDQTQVLGGLLEFTTETQSLSTVALDTRAAVDGNIALISGGDLEFQGGDFTATGTINTDVAGETRILATVDTDFEYVQDLNNNSLLVVNTTTVDVTQTPSFTQFTSGLGAEGVNLDPTSAVTFGLVQEQAAVGTAAMALVGVQDVSDPTQDMALTAFFLPDATGSPDGTDRLGELTDNPLILALAGNGDGGDDGGDTGSGETNPMFDFAGSMVDVGLPSAADGAGFAYIDELLTRDNVTVEDMALVQFGYEDQQVSLGVVGQLVLTYVSGGIAGGLSTTLGITSTIGQAMVTSAVSGVLEGAITGNFDIESILTDVAFAGVSSYATSTFNLDELAGLGDATNGSLIGAGTGQFSINNIVDQFGDSIIGAGLTTAVYGGNFGDNFVSSFQSGVVSLATADVQNLIGDRFAEGANGGEGSIEHVLTHALAGCGSAVLSGGDCGAGAAAAAVAAIGSGIIDSSTLTPQEAAAWTDEIALLSGLGAALTGADAEDVMAASAIGESAFTNNYLNHAQQERARLLLDVLDLFEDSAWDCLISRGCEVPAELAALLADRPDLLVTGYQNIGTRDAIRAYLRGEIAALQQTSIRNTNDMMAACLGGNQSECQRHLSLATDFQQWHDAGWLDGTGAFTTGSASLSEQLEWSRDLDQLLIEEYSTIDLSDPDARDAALARVVERASRFDGWVNIGISGVAGAGVALACVGTVGAGCVLSGAAAMVAQGDELIDGAVTVISGQPVENPQVALFMLAGASREQAVQIEQWIEIGATIIEVGGVFVAVRGGAVVGRVTPDGPPVSAGDVSVRPPGATAADDVPIASVNADGTAGSIRDVNPTGGTQNCVNCSIATDNTLAGFPTSALPGNPTSVRVLEEYFGTTFRSVTSPQDITNIMTNAGDGARGIVFGSRGPNEVGHVFNVVNQNGTIRFLDGQTGTAANLNSGYQQFFFLPTN